MAAHSPRDDLKKYIKMKCIYRAIQDGWHVHLKEKTESPPREVYVFEKDHQGDTKRFECDDFVEGFLERYIAKPASS